MARLKRGYAVGRMKNLARAAARYPESTILFAAAAALLAWEIQKGAAPTTLFYVFFAGAFLFACAKALYEGFFSGGAARFAASAGALVLSAAFYFLTKLEPGGNGALALRFFAVLVAALFLFIAIPSFKKGWISFSQSFLAFFKAFFLTLLYALVLFAGFALLLFAVDRLIVSVDGNLYLHAANLIFILFGPVFLLSGIPDDARGGEAAPSEAVVCPKQLAALLLYIVMPLIAAYTVVLAIYLALNLPAVLFGESLLKPLFIGYAVAVLVACFLAGTIEKRPAPLFLAVFPKAAAILALVQLVSSLSEAARRGILPEIALMLFAAAATLAAGTLLSLKSAAGGRAAALAVALAALLAVLPPVDVFTLSRVSQEAGLRSLLTEKGMLTEGGILPAQKGGLTEDERERIVEAVGFLNGYRARPSFLPEGLEKDETFQRVFGFSRYARLEEGEGTVFLTLTAPGGAAFDVSGYDLALRFTVQFEEGGGFISGQKTSFEKGGASYSLEVRKEGGSFDLALTEGERIVARLKGAEMLARFSEMATEPDGKRELTAEQAVFDGGPEGGGRAAVRAFVELADLSLRDGKTTLYADLTVALRLP